MIAFPFPPTMTKPLSCDSGFVLRGLKLIVTPIQRANYITLNMAFSRDLDVITNFSELFTAMRSYENLSVSNALVTVTYSSSSSGTSSPT